MIQYEQLHECFQWCLSTSALKGAFTATQTSSSLWLLQLHISNAALSHLLSWLVFVEQVLCVDTWCKWVLSNEGGPSNWDGLKSEEILVTLPWQQNTMTQQRNSAMLSESLTDYNYWCGVFMAQCSVFCEGCAITGTANYMAYLDQRHCRGCSIAVK